MDLLNLCNDGGLWCPYIKLVMFFILFHFVLNLSHMIFLFFNFINAKIKLNNYKLSQKIENKKDVKDYKNKHQDDFRWDLLEYFLSKSLKKYLHMSEKTFLSKINDIGFTSDRFENIFLLRFSFLKILCFIAIFILILFYMIIFFQTPEVIDNMKIELNIKKIIYFIFYDPIRVFFFTFLNIVFSILILICNKIMFRWLSAKIFYFEYKFFQKNFRS